MLKNILGNFSFYSLGPAIVGIVTFLFLPVISDYIPPEGQGVLGLLDIIQRYFLIIATLQIGSGIVRIYMDVGKEEEKRYVGSVFVFLLVLDVLSIFLFGFFLYFFSDRIFNDDTVAFFPYVFLKLISCFLVVIPVVPRGIFYAKEESAKIFFIKLAAFSVDISLTLSLLTVFNLGVKAVLIANIFSHSVELGLFLFYMSKHAVFCFDKKYIVKTLLFSLPFVPATLGTATYEHADRYIIQAYMTLRDVGIYTFAQKFLLPLSVIVFAIDKAFLPVYINCRKNSSTTEELNKIMNQLSLFLGLTTISVVYLATEIKFLINVEFMESFDYIAYIAIFWFLVMMYVFPSTILVYNKKSKYFIPINLVPALFNVGGNLLLVPKFGINGAIASTVACGSITLILTHIIAYRMDRDAFDYFRIFVFTLCVSIYCVANNYITGNLLMETITKVVLLATYVAIGGLILRINVVKMLKEIFEKG